MMAPFVVTCWSGNILRVRGAVKPTEPSAEQLAFRFVSGHRALDFVTTLGDRYHDGVERLRQPADLDRWLRSAGIPASTPAGAKDLNDARQLREVIYRLARAVLHREPVDTEDITELNGWARQPPLAPQLDSGLHRAWVSPQPIKGALALIACEAIELLTGPERELIRECAAAPACSLLYLDRSRGRRRRWCEMERCGSRAKMAEYRKRRARDGDAVAAER
jgi:predicted RNA-binding Zn ribbon-like protein